MYQNALKIYQVYVHVHDPNWNIKNLVKDKDVKGILSDQNHPSILC